VLSTAKDNLTVVAVVLKDTLSQVPLEENIEAVAKEKPSLPNRSLLQ